MRVGDFTVHTLSDGEFRLDGGAMFGVVPKPLWSRRKPADEQNRIRMATNCLLLERGDDLVLVDTGIGEKVDEKEAGHLAFDLGGRRLPDHLAEHGFAPEDVTHVLLTHLHFDHCGWNTRRSGDDWVPTFPRARYWIPRAELEHARRPNERDRSSYHPENWEPLVEAGCLELYEDGATPLPGVALHVLGGHSPGLTIVEFGRGAERAAFLADLIPTTAHVPWAWIMSYDLEPMVTLAHKQEWVPRLASEGWRCCFEHDPDQPWGRIVEARPGRFQVESLETPAAAGAP